MRKGEKMDKNNYLKVVDENIKGDSKEKLVKQIDNYFIIKEKIIEKKRYNVGEEVKLEKGTLLHGTYKNYNGLKEIVKNGLISSWFTNDRLSKYPSSVGVWKLKKEYLLKEYINFYSGGTIMYCGIFENEVNTKENKTEVIPYNEMNKITEITKKVNCHMWTMEQTKEARFMPSIVQDRIQIGIIIGKNEYTQKLLEGDILDSNNFADEEVRPFVNPDYYERFIKERKNKDDFFTDRESALLFGVPSNLIEGILVGRKYEKDSKILNEIKTLLPDCYICNLDGKVIIGNKGDKYE